MAFLKAVVSSNNKALNADLKLTFLSQKESYKKDICYFKVENIQALDMLEEYYETHTLPIFKTTEDDVLIRVYLKYIDDKVITLGKNKTYNTKCRFSLWELDKKIGFSVYINEINEA
jgi:hypothetical protein